MQDTVYLRIDQSKKITKDDITVKDVATISCTDEKLKNRINAIKLYSFAGKTQTRIIISSLKIIDEIQKELPGISLTPLGETDILIELNIKKNPSLWMIYTKVALICLIVFFGAAFTIMAFNMDVAVHDVFEMFYEQVMGKESDGFTILEFTYSLGLAIGILVFYNHFGAKRLSKDPTPIEVEMRSYEQEINSTLISGVKRKGGHIDVD